MHSLGRARVGRGRLSVFVLVRPGVLLNVDVQRGSALLIIPSNTMLDLTLADTPVRIGDKHKARLSIFTGDPML